MNRARHLGWKCPDLIKALGEPNSLTCIEIYRKILVLRRQDRAYKFDSNQVGSYGIRVDATRLRGNSPYKGKE